MITITEVGGPELAAAFAELGASALPVTAQALYTEGQAILTDAKTNYVPVDFGILRASGFVEPPKVSSGEASVDIGFGDASAPYALAVHENPRAGRTFGLGPVRNGKQVRYKHFAQTGMWKYLETPWKAAAPAMTDHLAEALQEAVAAMGHS